MARLGMRGARCAGRSFWPRLIAVLLALSPLAAVNADADDPDLDLERAGRIELMLKSDVAAGRIAGAVAVIAIDDRVRYATSAGFANASERRPMTEDALFRVASMTKPVVSLVALMLMEEGRLSLSDPISAFLPALRDMRVRNAEGEKVPARREPTIHDLLRHTSGFTYSFAGAAAAPLRRLYAEQDLEQQTGSLSSEAFIEKLAGLPLAFEPGTRFEYGISTDVLGIVLERITGQTLDILLQERVFKPLGMKDTGFVVPKGQAGRLAQVIATDPMKGWMDGWMRIVEERPAGYLSGGGGLITTARDYLAFATLLMNDGAYRGGRLLSPAAMRLMRSNHIAGLAGGPEPFTGPGYGFGLGLAVRLADGEGFVPGSRGDFNWSGISGTTFTVDPARRLAAVLLTAAPSQRNRTRFMFKNLVYGALTHD